MFVLCLSKVQTETAVGTVFVALKPLVRAIVMEVVRAGQLDHMVILVELFEANTAHRVRFKHQVFDSVQVAVPFLLTATTTTTVSLMLLTVVLLLKVFWIVR